MKSNLFKLSAVAIATIFLFASCSSDNDKEPWIEPVFSTTGAYIINEGYWDSPNSSKLSYYDIEKKEVTGEVFKNQNGLGLGDTANDGIIYGGKMYFVIHGSNTIFVTDLSGKLIPEIGTINLSKDENNKDLTLPRYVVPHNGHVYVDFFSGHVVKLDTTNLKITDKLNITGYPDQMAVVASTNELYITQSDYMGDGSGKTVTVVDLNTFKTKGNPIEVSLNPQTITSDGLGNLFVASPGDYGDVKDAVSIINSGTKKVEKVLDETATHFALLGNRMLMIRNQWGEERKYSEYDVFTKQFTDKSFLTMPTEPKINMEDFTSMAVDPTSKDIYITTSKYGEDGKVFIFSEKGIYKSQFSSKGQGVKKVMFIQKQVN